MASKFNDKKIKEATTMIHKITSALMKNLEMYKTAKAKGEDTKKFMKISKQLVDSKKNWQKELDNQIMQMDKGVELAMTESKLLNENKFDEAVEGVEASVYGMSLNVVANVIVKALKTSYGSNAGKIVMQINKLLKIR